MPFIQARAKFTDGANGRIYIENSPILNVNNVPPTGNLGDWDYQDLTLEYQAGYAGSSCEVSLFTSNNEVGQLKDIIINDPNGVVTVTNSKSGSITIVKITSTGRAGLVSFRFPAKFNSLTIWNKIKEVVSSYPALKGFRSFGNTLRQVVIRISYYSYEIPVNIPSTLKIIQFGIETFEFETEVGSTEFNDPKISHWDVSNLEARSFDYMFANCTNFNQDLSRWCVSQVTSPPIYFSVGSALTPANHPVWGTCPVVVSPVYSAGYYNAISGGTKVTQSGSSQTKYLRFKLDKIPAGTVLTLKAGPHSTPASGYYTDFTVLKANGAIDSSNGVKTRMYGDGSPNREITLIFPNAVIDPTEFVIAVNIWNVIYTKDRYGASCTNYVYQGTKAVVAEYISLTWATNY